MPQSRSGQRTANNRELGVAGENRAAEHLSQRGYRIVARNVRAGGVELDLIVRRGPLVVFVEVKTRRAGGRGQGEDAVDARKRARLIRGAGAWLCANGRGVRRTRFDVIVCEVGERGTGQESWRLRHWEAAFDANG